MIKLLMTFSWYIWQFLLLKAPARIWCLYFANDKIDWTNVVETPCNFHICLIIIIIIL